jgi:hypothetical protein
MITRFHIDSSVTISFLNKIRKHCPEIPFIIVRTKTDLKAGDPQYREVMTDPVSVEEGADMARKIGAIAFVEWYDSKISV